MQQKIYFYTTGQNYDIFSNVTDVGFAMSINGKEYHARSSEAFYQGVKGLTLPGKQAAAETLIGDQNAPGGHLQKAGQQFDNPIYHQSLGNWTVKEQLMYEILLCKATQNPILLKALLETGNAELIENSPKDEFWGIGKGNGRNALGKIWIRIRDELGAEYRNLGTFGVIMIRAGLSDALAAKLGHTQHKPNTQVFGHLPHPAASWFFDEYPISKSDLDSIPSPAPITVAGLRLAATPVHQQPQAAPAPAAAAPQPKTAAERVKAATGAVNLAVVDDRNIVGQKVIKLTFSDANKANAFAKSANTTADQNHNVFLGPERSRLTFNHYNIGTHGRANPHSMFDALVFDAKQAQQPVPAAAAAPHQTAAQRVVNATGAARVAVKDDVKVPGQKVVMLSFNSAREAQDFAQQKAGGAFVDKANNVFLGPQRARQVFDRLDIGTHGRTNPHPMFDALVFDAQQAQSQGVGTQALAQGNAAIGRKR